MGAIILLEKSQRVPCALAVSPIKVSEYVLSKIVSLSTVSIGVAFIVAVSVGAKNLFWVAVGTILSGTIFTLLGIIVAIMCHYSVSYFDRNVAVSGALF